MSTVFVVERGEYSDYSVIGVFSTRAHADATAAKINHTRTADNATVAEWPLDPAIEAIYAGMSQYDVQMLADGTVEQCGETRYWTGLAESNRLWKRSQNAWLNKPDVLQATVWAKDETHAIKIVNEHRTRMIAEGEWIV